MRISIEANVRRGLRIIENIPDIPLCRIEGYNGIGKTSSIKLLQLCCGDQPFEGHESAWRTFRDQLINAKVEISNLRDGEKIEWQINTSKWPITPEVPTDDFAVVRIGGKMAKLRDVREILEVHHVRADETLQDMLVQYSDSASNHINSWLNSVGSSRIESTDRALKAVYDIVASCLPSQIPLDLQSAIDSEKSTQAARELFEQKRDLVSLLQTAVEILDKMDQVRGRGAEMDTKLEELREKIENLSNKKSELDEKITEASERQKLDSDAEKEFGLAQKQLLRQEKQYSAARTLLEEECSKASVSSDPKAIELAKRSTANRLSELVALQPQIHATPLVIELLQRMIRPLEEAEEANLGDQILVEDEEENLRKTATQLKGLLTGRMMELQSHSPDGEAAELERNIELARERLSTLADIDSLIIKSEEAAKGHDRAKQRLKTAAAALPATTAKTLNELLTERNQVDAQATATQLHHTRLQQARELLGGGQTEDALAAELVKLSSSTGVDVSRMRGRLQTESTELEELAKRNVVASQQATRARRVADERTAQLTQVINDISSPAAPAWLRAAIPGISDLAESSMEEKSQVLVQILTSIETARNRLSNAVRSVQGISGALENVVKLLKNGESVSGAWNESVRAWLSEEVLRWFNNEQVRQALFNGGADIALDPLAMTVSWVDSNGSRFDRPLTAFSSGQQAFAFTRARVAQLDREAHQAANRLIALDEFGSVIDSERMSHLASYLDERRLQRPHDQVVVILPLREDFIESSNTGAAAEHKKSLSGSGYFAEPLRP